MAKILSAVMTFDISSTNVGYVLAFPGEELKVGSFTPGPKSKDLRRVLEIGLQAEAFAKEHATWFRNGLYAWVEQPFYSKGGSFDLPIKMAHGVMLQAFGRVTNPLRFHWNYVNVNTWRAYLNKSGLSSEQKKFAVMNDVTQEFGIEPANNDEGDALGIYSWYLKEMVL